MDHGPETAKMSQPLTALPADGARPGGGVALPGERIAVIGSGVAGLTAAWLLAPHFPVTLFEEAPRFGGHANTAMVPTRDGPVAVDAGFIVFNKPNYPNLTALFAHLDIPLEETCMSFAASLDGGQTEYAGHSLSSVFARRRSVLSPAHWAMLRDVPRFHRDARAALDAPVNAPVDTKIDAKVDDGVSLADFVRARGYSASFVRNFLEPMAAAIWSTPSVRVLDFPAFAFFRFFANHGLLQVLNMPLWNTVSGGSAVYVEKLIRAINAAAESHQGQGTHAGDTIGPGAHAGLGARRVIRKRDATVDVVCTDGATRNFHHVVIATHANQALALLDDPDTDEKAILGAFGYQKNTAVLHKSAAFMPQRKRAWASWNYLDGRANDANGLKIEGAPAVTYWMNRLQNLPCRDDIFVTLNPPTGIDDADIVAVYEYEHPVFDIAAGRAQKALWGLQGISRGAPFNQPVNQPMNHHVNDRAGRQGGVWFCGAHFGQGFHEDGAQAGLAVAEALGGVRRPWQVENESARIFLPASEPAHASQAA